MRQLSEADASFIYLETPENPLHIGCLLLLDDSSLESPLSCNALKGALQQRLHLVPTMRQRIVQLPLKLDNPYWADDPEFNLDRHIRDITLPSPGRFGTLMRFVGESLATPLNKDKPLWEITLFRGLGDIDRCPEATCAVLFKIHQTLIDSTTGSELIGSLLDTSGTTQKVRGVIPPWTPQPLPSMAQMIGHAYGNALTMPKRWAVLARDAAASTFYQALMHQFRQLALPVAIFNAPAAPFNRPISARRTYDAYCCSFEKIRHLKQKAPGVSTNAVLMTLCSEALQRYIQHKDPNMRGALTVLTPVSVRSKQVDSPTGSQLAAMIVSLATDEPDLAKRLLRIHTAMKSSKVYSHAVAADRLTQLAPTALLGLAARTYSEFQIAQRHKPIFNLPITNIPGPARPNFLAGAKITGQISSTPLFDGLGLSVTILTYCDKAIISLTACPDTLPDLDRLTLQFEGALEALADALEQTDWKGLEAQADSLNPHNQSLWSALLEDSQPVFQHILSHWIGRDRREKARD